MTLGGSCGIIVICMCVRMRKRLTFDYWTEIKPASFFYLQCLPHATGSLPRCVIARESGPVTRDVPLLLEVSYLRTQRIESRNQS